MNVIIWNALIINSFLSRTVGPYKIAHWLRKHKYDVQVIDFVHLLSEEQLFEVTCHFITSETKILGISTTFFQWEAQKHSDGVFRRIPETMLNVLRKIKLSYPHIKLVLGGYQSESIPDYDVFDATVMSYNGPTEEIFLEYLEHLIHGKPEPRSELMLENGRKTRPFYNKASTTIYNIEHDDFMFTEQDCILPNEPLPLDISRGCIFTCKFCQYPYTGKKKYDYVRGMEFLEQEILNNYRLFGTTSYYLVDDTFNDTQQKLQEFHAMTQRLPFKITFTAYLRCDLLHRFPDSAYLLKDSGLFGAYFGLESLHPEASKLIGKAWSGKHAKDYVPKIYHNIWNKEVMVHTNFIVGLTHDTTENIYDTAQWYLDNDLHSINFDRLGLWGPGKNGRFQTKSEFDTNPEKYGYTLEYINDSEIPDWKTDNWTKESASKVSYRVSKIIENHSKANPWRALTYQMLGVSKEDLLNTPGTQLYRQSFGNAFKVKSLIDTYLSLLFKQ